jgi:hypothetical protein
MLTAETISAVRLRLSDGVEAVLVQEGPEWNTLRQYRCVAPAAFVDQKLVTSPQMDEGPLKNFFDCVLGRVEDRPIVMASPALGAAIIAINAAQKPAKAAA